jgi:NCS1 family nucleobase:cation symporter-1
VTTTGTPPITTVERRGIEYIPLSRRWGTPGGLFWMWAGAIWNVEFLVYGVLGIVVFGLSFTQAVAVIVAGNVSYMLTGLAGAAIAAPATRHVAPAP